MSLPHVPNLEDHLNMIDSNASVTPLIHLAFIQEAVQPCLCTLLLQRTLPWQSIATDLDS